jgi:hypothetical protein
MPEGAAPPMDAEYARADAFVHLLFASALLYAALLCSAALAADDPPFTCHWTLKAEQSEIHPGHSG